MHWDYKALLVEVFKNLYCSRESKSLLHLFFLAPSPPFWAEAVIHNLLGVQRVVPSNQPPRVRAKSTNQAVQRQKKQCPALKLPQFGSWIEGDSQLYSPPPAALACSRLNKPSWRWWHGDPPQHLSLQQPRRCFPGQQQLRWLLTC